MIRSRLTNTYQRSEHQFRALNAVALLVALTGFITIDSILFNLLHFKDVILVSTDAHLTLFAGLSLIYLATLLNRGKHTAWLVSVPVYIYLFLRNVRHYGFDFPSSINHTLPYLLDLVLPLATLIALIYYRQLFNVRSEIRSFTTALQRSLVIIIVAFAYGVAGFILLDQHDFHQEINLVNGAHYTIDQFGWTTHKHVIPYTKRAHIFVDSLAAISLGALFYTSLSLFSPIRFRLGNHQQDYEDVRRILRHHSNTSEDFFMLWPTDKSYFFNTWRTAVIAYKATHGVALIAGDPVGPAEAIEELMSEFMGFCRVNDWQPAFIHAEAKNLELYKTFGFEHQKIGQEAIIYTADFVNRVSRNKDFRHIKNKFEKLGYSCQTLSPPHSQQLLERLRAISNDWLSKPGRAERSFILGYFSYDYLQLCDLMVAKDGKGEIQAFINQIPSPTADEANFDFLRHSSGSPGNLNDYLMLNFISSVHSRHIPRLNMGLAPLAGLGRANKGESRLLNGFLKLAYTKANFFYSFQGLQRFKSKYEPKWEDRYVLYKGGLAGFTKTANAVVRATRVPRHFDIKNGPRIHADR